MSTENSMEGHSSGGKNMGIFAPFFVWLLFAIIFFGISVSQTPFVADITNQRILDIFVKYARFSGAIFGLLSMVLAYILYIIRRIIRFHTNRFSTPIVCILSVCPWLIFGYQLVFLEPRYTVLARAIISFFGEPMLYTSGVLVVLNVVWLLILPFKKHA